MRLPRSVIAALAGFAIATGLPAQGTKPSEPAKDPPAQSADSAAQHYRLLRAPGDNRAESVLIVPPNGRVRVEFSRPDAEVNQAATVDLRLSQFKSTDDRAASIGLGSPSELPVKLEGKLLSIELQADDLHAGVTYAGTLSIVRASGAVEEVFKLSLLRPKPTGELVLDRPSVDLKLSEPQGEFSLTLRDKSGTNKLTGVTVRRDGVTVSPRGDFDFDRHVTFVWSKNVEADPCKQKDANAIPTSEWVIPKGRQETVTVWLCDLEAGEYEFTLRFDAVESESTDAQKLAVTVKVKNHWSWASLVLFLGGLLSWVTTVGVKNWQLKAGFASRLDALKEDWLRHVPQCAPVVWLRSEIRQIEDLATEWLLSTPDGIAKRLDRAELLFKLVRTYYEIHLAIEAARSAAGTMTRHEATKRLDKLMRDVDPGSLDDAAAKERLAAFEKVRKGLVDPVEAFWTGVRDAAQSVVGRVGELQDNKELQGYAEALNKALKKFPSDKKDRQPTREELETIDKESAVLRILLDRRSKPAWSSELRKVVGPKIEEVDIDAFFRLANQQVWNRLEQGHCERKQEQKFIQIIPNASHHAQREYEALQPIDFSLIIPDNEWLEHEFYFTSKVTCEWKFEHLRKVWWRFKPIESDWGPATSRGNRIAQFAPAKGELTVSVTLRDGDGRDISVAPSPLPVTRPSDWALGVLHWSKSVSFLYALVISVLSGLSLYYFTNETFGSFPNYVSLFSWAVGIDIGKNLLQTMKTPENKTP